MYFSPFYFGIRNLMQNESSQGAEFMQSHATKSDTADAIRHSVVCDQVVKL